MSAAQQSANKVLLRVVDPSLDSSNVHQKSLNYEVYLAKYHAKSGKHFYCNLLTKSTSWDAPADTVEANADGKSADIIWTEIQAAFAEVDGASEALKAAQQALLIAEKKKVALLEGLRPPTLHQDQGGKASVSAVKANVEVSVANKRDSAKASSKSASSPLPAVLGAADVAPPIAISAVSAAATPVAASVSLSNHATTNTTAPGRRIFIEWKKHKPEPSPAISSAQLQQALLQFGAIDSAFVVFDRLAQKSQPFGFVEFKNAESAARAVGSKKIQIGEVVANTTFARGPN